MLPIHRDGVLALGLLLASIAFAVGRLSPPRAKDINAALEDFSAARAMTHVRAIAQEPHPVGTSAHARARQYILNELTAVGLEPENHSAIVTARFVGRIRTARVHNIVARKKGQGGSHTILMMAHYDSVENAPGAADDSSAVATLLETARSLTAGGPLKNEVIFLITDAEEIGLLGARAAVRDLPWVEEVDLVLNFEARGNRGPAAMFETIGNNSEVIVGFAAAAPRPVASSLIANLARLLPNDTDLTAWGPTGVAGLNFAFADGLERYHTAADNIEGLDPRSLQHDGDYGLAMVRHFGNLEQSWKATDNRVYFDVASLFVVHYRTSWAWLWLFFGVSLVGGAIFLGRKSGASLRRIAAAWGMHLGVVFASAIVVQVLATAVSHGVDRRLVWTQNRFFLVGYLLLGGALWLLWLKPFAKRISPWERLAGSLPNWLIPAALTTWLAPGSSYAFTWPMIFAAGQACLLAMSERPGKERLGVWSDFLLVPQGLMIAAVVYVMLLMDGGLMPGPAMAYAAFGFAGLGVVWLRLPRVAHGFKAIGICALASILALLFGIATFRPGTSGPRYTTLKYGHDAVSGETLWLGDPADEDPWLEPLFANNANTGDLSAFSVFTKTRRFVPADPVDLPSPSITLLDETRVPEGRKLSLAVRSQRNARAIHLWREMGPGILATRVNGEVPISHTRFNSETDAKFGELILGETRSSWKVILYQLGDEEVILEVVTGDAPLQLRVMDETPGIPPLPAGISLPRPQGSAPSQESDVTLVSQVFVF